MRVGKIQFRVGPFLTQYLIRYSRLLILFMHTNENRPWTRILILCQYAVKSENVNPRTACNQGHALKSKVLKREIFKNFPYGF